ncbi:metallopeptidase (SprT family) [Mangrovimicrobium sediminis]|uniref:Metallopeptidase (SprT family) n=1 Tax=Mangrovimicrobium sediminis TaxID=2562682 RepID=A0A4Z0LXN6_9GAMM|nr:SprT-like domain-containing protein [Haliea sp. SAOS-164]TGD71918.1 metallopeptidase (SprT family) [Haliea sp. SAOS-164]
MIEPIGELARREVRELTEACILRAERELGRKLPRPAVSFDLTGVSAGMFRVRDGRAEIRYNPWIFAKYWAENTGDTIPHEVAHFVVHATRGRRRPQPHGPEWRRWMRVFGVEPSVTFDLDLSGIPRRSQRTHDYRCPCRRHSLSSTRHNRVQRGTGSYLCRYCKGPLEYCG